MQARTLEVVEYDIRGQICPSTLLIALKEMNIHRDGLRGGTTALRFLTDNRDCLVTIPESAQNMGYAAAVSQDPDRFYVIEICAEPAREQRP